MLRHLITISKETIVRKSGQGVRLTFVMCEKGPEEELAKLREPLSSLNPRFFTLEYGFRR